jgi:indolepyruvate ferredoxin oxidoreductase beta subunit
MSITNIVLAGVGGQGSVLATQVLARALANAGERVVTSEVHGMSQRGGTVVTTIRFGDDAWSSVVPLGEADYLVAFEELEAARHLEYLRPNGIAITSDQRVQPSTEALKRSPYPADVQALAAGRCRELLEVPALAIAQELGNAKLAGTVVLGALSRYLDIPEPAWIAAIGDTVPPHTVEKNLEAFRRGAAWRRALERAVPAV